MLEEISSTTSFPAGKTELQLLELDPHRVHVYWNVEPEHADHQRSLTLRVYDVTGAEHVAQAGQVFDVNVQGEKGHWYLDFWRDDRTFVADLGYCRPDGSLDLLARSNEVTTPSAPPPATTGHVDPRGRPLHTELPAPSAEDIAREPDPEFPGLVATDPPSTAATDVMTGPSAETIDQSFIRAAGESAVVFVDEEDLPGIHPQEFPAASELTDLVLENHEAVKAFYRAVELLPPPPPLPARAEGSSICTGRDLANATPAPNPWPWSQAIGLSSPTRAGVDPGVEVHVELRIFGRAQPNRELSLFGQVIKVGPDGAFSITRNLPDSANVAPLLQSFRP